MVRCTGMVVMVVKMIRVMFLKYSNVWAMTRYRK